MCPQLMNWIVTGSEVLMGVKKNSSRYDGRLAAFGTAKYWIGSPGRTFVTFSQKTPCWANTLLDASSPETQKFRT